MTTSTIGTLTIDGKEYVVIPLEQYRRAFDEHGVRVVHEDELTEQDRGDLAELKRRKATEKPVPYAEARKSMGLDE